ncbi:MULTISPECIES: PIN-like domain-containing protein [unclassified Pseudomonas]|uniref:PIN-like domain-containing protein n=1 Tax=unclassified Pseudomonas TaxID=196821 RepID=UPI000B6C0159|nr:MULTISPECIES: PIN-like domain-containing protein [Pseudomonas]SNT47194.1 hypothetical protein SAMN05660216_04742 [Pseudomonas sp. LAMO17WK12:I8]SNY39805.1 hypothetical protein SAMN05660344_04647 [Pseudomonas sp. LAMO17WK12:I11]SNY39910.1 hypothetical protein SAMN05660893_04601 [Pseudomonas sp. LAMO17WK12:I12]SNY40812.1 hypothetical protein SAMN05660700_04744 [Pseudomonas sp. LAMO17WK12:I7]
MTEKTQIDSVLQMHEDFDDKTIELMWGRALFVFDSNVLLDLYRLPVNAKNELLNVLRHPKIKDRIWIGFQGLLEFLNNRHDIIGDQKSKFEEVRGLLNDANANYKESLKILMAGLERLRLSKRHSLIEPEKYITYEKINSGIDFINDFLGELDKLEEKQPDVHQADNTKAQVLEIFSGKVGDGFDKDELYRIYDEGEERYKQEIPPGYKDKGKKHFYVVKDVEYKCKFGDLVFWKEVIRKARSESIEYLILVTGDVKPDWWFEKRGKKLGPRKELLNEIYSSATELKAFHMYDTSNFLRRVGERFTVDVSESTIFEAQSLIDSEREHDSSEWVDFFEILKLVASSFDKVILVQSPRITISPSIKIPLNNLFTALCEIVHNVICHGDNNRLHIDLLADNGFEVIQFTNTYSGRSPSAILPDDHHLQSSLTERRTGLAMIRSVLRREGISIRTSHTMDEYCLEMLIPKPIFKS